MHLNMKRSLNAHWGTYQLINITSVGNSTCHQHFKSIEYPPAAPSMHLQRLTQKESVQLHVLQVIPMKYQSLALENSQRNPALLLLKE